MTMWDRMYRRFGRRYIHVLLVIAALSIVALTLPGTAVAGVYGVHTFSVFMRVFTVAVPILAVAAVGAELVVARVLAPVIRWVDGDQGSANAAEAWEAAVVGLGPAVLFGGLVVLLGAIPAELYGAQVIGLHGTAGAVATCLAISIVIASGGMLHFFCWEQALRPVVLDIAQHLGTDYRPARSSLSAGAKLLILLPVMNALVGMVAAGIPSDSQGHSGKIVVGVAAGLVISATIALGLALLLRNSLLRPLRALEAAIVDIEAGDLTARVAPTTADELGGVIRSFNTMVEGLAERESLRVDNAELAHARKVLLEELQASQARIVAASDAERRRMERDLHDGAQQRLVVLQLQLGVLNKQLENQGVVAPMVADLRENVASALGELRDLAHGIYPTVLETDGLPGALADAVTRCGMDGDLTSESIGRYPAELEAAVYFCCNEALQNAAKHAGHDARVHIRIAERDGALEFEVNDDGAGFDLDTAAASSGLQNMTDRIGALGGTLAIASRLTQGTAVRGRLPIDAIDARLSAHAVSSAPPPA